MKEQTNDVFMRVASGKFAYSEYQKKEAGTNKEAFNRAKRALPEVMKLLPKKTTYLHLFIFCRAKKHCRNSKAVPS